MASRPLGKSHPRTKLILTAAALGGLIIGFGIGITRDLLDRVFRGSEQVESLLQTDCIALVPYEFNEKLNGDVDAKSGQDGTVGGRSLANSLIFRSSEAIRSLSVVSESCTERSSLQLKSSTLLTSSLSEQGNDAAAPASSDDQSTDTSSSRSRTIVRNSNALWTVVDAPLSRYTEAIRSIELANDLNGVIKPNRVIGFTSSLPNEGKSTIAFSVAQLMAQAQVGGKTILVDCDLRNPSLTRMLTPDAKAGLLEILAEKTSLKAAIWKDPSTNLSFLPVVSKLRLAHSSEILGSTPLKKLFEQLREAYDHVIVDLSPLAPIVDVRATAHLLDSFVFVASSGDAQRLIL